MHFISWLLSLWGTPLFPKYLLSLISVRLGKSNFFALDIFFSFARTLYRTTFQIFLLMIYHKEFMFVILNYLTFYVIFKVIACFIYFTSEISVMGHTEISVMECTDRNFCTPHYRTFVRKADETSYGHGLLSNEKIEIASENCHRFVAFIRTYSYLLSSL